MNKLLRFGWLITVVSLASCTTIGRKNAPGSGYTLPGVATISDTVFETGLGVKIHSGRSVDMNVVEISPDRSSTTIPITGTITLGNHNATPNNFAITALVNYEQTPSTIGTDTETIHLVTVNAFSDKNFDFMVQLPNQEGRYKLWWVVFVFPDKHDLDRQSRISLSKVNSFASDILVGADANFPSPIYQKLASTSSVSTGFSGGPEINRSSSDPQAGWFTDTVKVDTRLSYFVHLGHSNRPITNYALVAFLDGYQIPVQRHAPDAVFWGIIEADSFLAVPATVQTPRVTGIHELEVLYIPEPYGVEGTEAIQGMIPRSSVWGSIQNSMRVGLITTEK